MSTIGIVAVNYHLPPDRKSVRDIFAEEGVSYTDKIAAEIGIEQVPIFKGALPSDMAIEAAKECIEKASIKPDEIDVIVDCSVLPQDYVVPSWCMSNKIQHEIGATKAFNLGFGGGGTTNILVALQIVSSIILTEEHVNTALLVASDISLLNNRIINRNSPLTILGDGASAMIVAKGAKQSEILGAELWSDGNLHDVCLVHGGGLAYPDRLDLYRLQINTNKFSREKTSNTLRKLSYTLTDRLGIGISEIQHLIYPNISVKDQKAYNETFPDINGEQFADNLQKYGHIQCTDFSINLTKLIDSVGDQSKRLCMLCTHGWGFMNGVMLLKC